MTKTLRELEQNLAKAPDDPGKLEALLQLADHHSNDDYIEGWRLCHEALGLAEKLHDRESRARAHCYMATTLWKLAEYTEALDHYEKALDDFLGIGDLHGVAKCYCGMGVICGAMEEYRTALDHFEEGLSAAKRSNRPHLAANITGNIGHVYFNLGRYTEAIECFEHGLNYFKANDIADGIANMLSGMAGVHVYQGEYAKGLELVRRALEVHKRTKHPRGIAVSMMNVGIALQKMGKLQKAKTELKSALNYTRSINLRMIEYDTLKHLSEVCSALEQEEESAEYLELYMEGQKEEKKLAVKRKEEQFRQRQQVMQMRGRS